MKGIKVALVQDWLTEMGGAEKVFKSIYELYPDSDVFTLVYSRDILNELGIPESKVKSSFIQNLPGSPRRYRMYLPLFKYAIEQFDLSEYDLVISSSYCVAKGILTNHNQVHICYCHSPVRYAWDFYHRYLSHGGFDTGFKGLIVKYFLHKIRLWDLMSSNRVDFFISNSNYIKSRIYKIYRRDAVTIYPPVNIDDFECVSEKQDFYFTCSRLVSYKYIDLIVEAFSHMPDRKLVVIGDGPDYHKIAAKATSNISILGFQPFSVLKEYMQTAKAFIFATEEDFGIAPVEAQACGTPVIAFGKGGIRETVVDGKTGIFFDEQTCEGIEQGVAAFDHTSLLSPQEISQHAGYFSTARFKREIQYFVSKRYKEITDAHLPVPRTASRMDSTLVVAINDLLGVPIHGPILSVK